MTLFLIWFLFGIAGFFLLRLSLIIDKNEDYLYSVKELFQVIKQHEVRYLTWSIILTSILIGLTCGFIIFIIGFMFLFVTVLIHIKKILPILNRPVFKGK